MRLLRVKLLNWGGVTAHDVRFAAEGVTIVEGPNESGKSSLLAALDLLFDEPDSSKKEALRAARPVHRDEGPEVEAEFTTGPYTLVYRKRYLKRPETSLTVRTPRPESHVGRGAHDRVEAILAETLDLTLWKALRVEQGGGLGALEVGDAAWLSAALERAAGGTAVGQRERTLLDVTHDEYLRWWTETGNERKETQESAGRAAAIELEVARVRDDLRRVDGEVEKAASLARQVAAERAALGDLQARAQEHARALKDIEGLRLSKAACERALAEAQRALGAAQGAEAERQRLVREASEAQGELARLTERLGADAPALAASAEALRAAGAEVAAAEARLRQAEDRLRLAEGDVRFRRAEIELEQLRERLGRIEAAEQEAQAAVVFLQRTNVTEAVLRGLREAQVAVVAARAAVDAARTTVALGARAPLQLRIDGEPQRLAAGETRALLVTGSTRIETPDLLVDVRAGASPAGPEQELARLSEAFASLCAKAQVADVEEAAAAWERRKEEQRRLDARDRVVKENLRDLTRERLEQKIAGLAPLVGAWPRERPPLAELPADHDLARASETTVRAALDVIKDQVAAARTRVEACRVAHEEASRLRSAAEGRLALLRDQGEARRHALEVARSAASDVQLQERSAHALAAQQQAAAALAGAQAALAAAGADAREALDRNASEAVKTAVDRLHAVEREQATVLGGLEVAGERGLGEALAQAEATLAHAQRELASLRAHAAAAKLLYDTLREEHATTRARYVAPYRQQIERLGQVVFGPTFLVEIDDDLTLVRRTVEGRSVPFERLSGGTKEQLGVVARLACAALVEEQGGVPVILDDVLGFSDERRLEEMGALLARAGKRSQVILLTCMPGRYRHVGGATVVRLETAQNST